MCKDGVTLAIQTIRGSCKSKNNGSKISEIFLKFGGGDHGMGPDSEISQTL
jgi:hypothetical protein